MRNVASAVISAFLISGGQDAMCADLKPLADADVVTAIKAQYGIDDPEPTPGWDDTFQVYTM